MPAGDVQCEAPSEPRLTRTFRGHRGAVTAVDAHPSGQQVVSGSRDGCVFVWQLRAQLRPFRFVGHRGQVHDIALSSPGLVPIWVSHVGVGCRACVRVCTAMPHRGCMAGPV
eukprot:NODE_27851_length_498_cov_3.851752.p3 GENE.NODE_27851_length_498_cov_3.851752~~NODE_27851_length_498_cov_3.851752.p3  ORF type:complete len:112 (+),score=19.59 NODE_27851_length_498_cov_3.851752:144-479(+)